MRGWGQRFHVSPRNPFRLLAHVGEECAGAVQFIAPEKTTDWLNNQAPSGITWLSSNELEERISDLISDHSQSRRQGDHGQFSLAGAQPKLGLYQEPDTGRWGIPHGTIPTTHILKPSPAVFDGYELNEFFFLSLASKMGLTTPFAWTESIAGIDTIVVERFDRKRQPDSTVIRIHQEDTCQAMGKPPEKKYQSDGGPSAKDIFGLIRDHSSKPMQDVSRFLDALIFNWLIGGTDAHSKNYGFLIAAGNQVRLAPLYDVTSYFPYQKRVTKREARLAMKIGNQYHFFRIGAREWEKAAREWKLDRDHVFSRITEMADQLPGAAETVASEIGSGSAVVCKLIGGISKSAKSCKNLL